MDKKRVLFICVRNSGRSQMAEAFFYDMAGDQAIASSAGTQPASEINPIVVEVMRETGLEIGHKIPRRLTLDMMENADRVITMGCGVEETCPAHIVPVEDWQVEDPEGKSIDKVRKIRDDIREKVAALTKEMAAENSITKKDK
jgi:arsenate reductase